MLMYHSQETCEGERRDGRESRRSETRDRTKKNTPENGAFFPVPVQYQVWSKDEFPRVVDGPPDESDHQHLQPGALQELHLIVKRQLHKTYKEGGGDRHELSGDIEIGDSAARNGFIQTKISCFLEADNLLNEPVCNLRSRKEADRSHSAVSLHL